MWFIFLLSIFLRFNVIFLEYFLFYIEDNGVFAQNNRDTNFFALLNLNANAQDAIIGPKKGEGTGKNLQFITTGGVLDLYVLAAKAPLELVSAYH